MCLSDRINGTRKIRYLTLFSKNKEYKTAQGNLMWWKMKVKSHCSHRTLPIEHKYSNLNAFNSTDWDGILWFIWWNELQLLTELHLIIYNSYPNLSRQSNNAVNLWLFSIYVDFFLFTQFFLNNFTSGTIFLQCVLHYVKMNNI